MPEEGNKYIPRDVLLGGKNWVIDSPSTQIKLKSFAAVDKRIPGFNPGENTKDKITVLQEYLLGYYSDFELIKASGLHRHSRAGDIQPDLVEIYYNKVAPQIVYTCLLGLARYTILIQALRCSKEDVIKLNRNQEKLSKTPWVFKSSSKLLRPEKTNVLDEITNFYFKSPLQQNVEDKEAIKEKLGKDFQAAFRFTEFDVLESIDEHYYGHSFYLISPADLLGYFPTEFEASGDLRSADYDLIFQQICRCLEFYSKRTLAPWKAGEVEIRTEETEIADLLYSLYKFAPEL